MSTEIKMPKLGQTTDFVHLLRWLVKVGDTVKKGDALAEVETDKTTMDLECFAAGTVLSITGAEDSDIPVGAVVAVIGEPGERIEAGSAWQPATDSTQRSADSGTEKPRGTGTASSAQTRASLVVRHLAEKWHIELSAVHGTGPGGMVTEKDLTTYRDAASTGTGAAEPPVLSDQQRRLGKLLAESKSTIPHYYLYATVFCDRLVAARERAKQGGSGRLTVDAVLIYAVARAIARFPGINRHLRGEELRSPAHVNVAFAASVSDDLVAPVIHDADRKEIAQINREVMDLAEKARKGRLERSDTAEATFTVSNLGRYAVEAFQAIITPGQGAILTAGRIQDRLYIGANKSTRVRPACTVCVSYDHRVINGAQGAEFLTEVKRFIEEEISES
ncbi:MAG: dihydrolipoamide acetyltransferase family protein [Spirochaetia bacterium]|jgi:pyruvate dehydrogenase E2 component (dihydrolipoamide acetyltransferase)